MAVTVRDLIDAARIRHNAFIDVELGDGAVLLFVNNRQMRLLLHFKTSLQGLLGTTAQTAATVGGALVGIDEDGAPFYLTTAGDGWALHLDADGVTPYVDVDEAPISFDPFGISGDTPGFPLPENVISVLAVSGVYADGRATPIDVFDEGERFSHRQTGRPMAFLSANRIVPKRDVNTTSDVWSLLTAVQLSYLALPQLTALSDRITLPPVLHEALIAAIASLLAGQAKLCTTAERAAFRADAERAEAILTDDSFDIVGALKTTRVIYRR